MKKIIVGILICLTLLTTFIVVSPTDELKAVETQSYGGDFKQLVNDFVIDSEKDVSVDNIVGYLNGNMQKGFGSGTGIGFVSEYRFDSADTQDISAAVLTSTKFVIAYCDGGNSYYGTAIIGEITGTTINYGLTYVFNPASTSDISIAALTSTKFVIAYCDVGSSSVGTAIIGDLSGSSPTIINYGSEVVFNLASTKDISIAALTIEKFIIAYTDVGNYRYGTVIIGSQAGPSGNYIAHGSEYVFNEASTKDISVAALTSTKFVIVYCDIGNSFVGTARIGIVSGVAISSYGLEYVFNPANTKDISVAALTSTKFVIAYCDSGNSNVGTAIIGDLSGSSPTMINYGPEAVFNPSRTDDISVTALASDRIAIVYYDFYGEYTGKAVYAYIIDTAISYGSTSHLTLIPAHAHYISVVPLTSNSIVVAFRNYSSSYAALGITKPGPNIPDMPSGPTNFPECGQAWYETSGTDPQNNPVQYRLVYDADGDHRYGHWTELGPSGHTTSIWGFWNSIGTFALRTQTRNKYRLLSLWSDGLTVFVSDTPPTTPNKPVGPSELQSQQVGFYTADGAVDPQNEEVAYRFDWDANGDHEYSGWTSLGPSGHAGIGSHSWDTHGVYVVKAQARDQYGAISDWSTGFTVTIINSPPDIPTIPNGPVNLKTDETGIYSTTAVDIDSDRVQYRFDWGDGTISDWTNLVNSGQSWSLSYSWSNTGRYNLRSQARDEYGLESDGWSDSLTVIVETANLPPMADANGPYHGNQNEIITLDGSGSSDSDGIIVSYEWDCDNDGQFDDAAGEFTTYFWDSSGDYIISLKVTDNYGASDTDDSTVHINAPPNKPSKPTGPTSGKTGIVYDYTSSTSDPDGDQVYYVWDWGDGNTELIGPYDSGDTVTLSHIWDIEDTYQIKVKSKDKNGLESEWSDPLVVSIPKYKYFSQFFTFLLDFLEQYPRLFPLLRQILKI